MLARGMAKKRLANPEAAHQYTKGGPESGEAIRLYLEVLKVMAVSHRTHLGVRIVFPDPQVCHETAARESIGTAWIGRMAAERESGEGPE